MNIYVRNLSPDVSRSELLRRFEDHGEVTGVPSKDQALVAIAALQGQNLGGSLLEIQEG
jgi:RNA recognition motif-containing protein